MASRGIHRRKSTLARSFLASASTAALCSPTALLKAHTALSSSVEAPAEPQDPPACSPKQPLGLYAPPEDHRMEGPGLTIAAGRPRRQRRTRITADGSDDEYGGGGTSSRLRVRMGHGHGGQQSANPADSVGWDRELDSDPDEPLAVEEHFVLRVPPEVAPKLKEQVDRRDVPADLWFKFKDSRRAVFHVDNKLYGAKLVDLPALLESQRLTGVGGQTVKVADVSQMLLVEEQIREEHDVTRDKVFNIEDFVYPHGITPPLKHVRKRRFRKRINRRVGRPGAVPQGTYPLTPRQLPADH